MCMHKTSLYWCLDISIHRICGYYPNRKCNVLHMLCASSLKNNEYRDEDRKQV